MPAAAQLLIFAAIVLIFWAVVMRPSRNQQREVRDVQRTVEVGDEVVISAGIFATVRSVDPVTVELEIAPGVVVTALRQVVVRRAADVKGADAGKDDDTDAGKDADTAAEGPDGENAADPAETDEKSE